MVSRVRTSSICEEFLRHIVRRSAFFGKMQLPQSLQPRRFFDNVPNRWRSAFFRAVVHDRHPRRDSVDQSRTSALTPAVVGDDVDINLPQLVFRTHQLHLFVMRQKNKLGKIDIYIVSHHGWSQSGSPALVYGIAPRVAIMDNGAKKGGTPSVWDIIEKSPGLENLWQLHFSDVGGTAHNVAE